MRGLMGIAVGCLLVVGLAACEAPEATTVSAVIDEAEVTPRETLVTELGELADDGWTPMKKASPDGRHLAWVVRDGRDVHVAVDGELGPAFEAIGEITNVTGDHGWHVCAEWSEDSAHVAYAGLRDRLYHAVINGEVSETGYKGIEFHEQATFSPDGARHAYAGTSKREAQMVIDGEPGPGFDTVSHLTFSPDSRRVAYVGTDEQEGDTLIVDGERVAAAERIDAYSLQFSPDGERFVYAVSKPEPQLFVDGEEWPLEHGVFFGTIFFTDDSRHVAYVDGHAWEHECRVVVDGVAGEEYRIVSRLQFAPDGETVCYSARVGWGQHFIVMGDDVSPAYDEVDPIALADPLHGMWWGPAPVFSANGEHYAYSAEQDGEAFVILDGEEQGRYAEVLPLVFSPDGAKLAHWVELADGRYAMVVNGEAIREHQGHGYAPIFSPDSRRMAYEVRELEGEHARVFYLVDGEEQPNGGVSRLSFSEDSRHFAYTMTVLDTTDPNGERQTSMVIDGDIGPAFERIHGTYAGTGPIFRPDGCVEYIAERGGTIFRVVQVPPG